MTSKLMKGVSLPWVKDKYGRNIKQHFGIWKYFIIPTLNKLKSKNDEEDRKKCYISLDCQLLEGK